MKILALGGAGRICREAVIDRVDFSDVNQITIAACDGPQGHPNILHAHPQPSASAQYKPYFFERSDFFASAWASEAIS